MDIISIIVDGSMKRVLSQRWMAASASMLLAGFAKVAGRVPPAALSTLEIIAETCRATATTSALESPADPQPAPRWSVSARDGPADSKLSLPSDR